MTKPNQDAEHVRLLAIFHYVLAGMVALFSLFPIFHLVIGVALVTGAFDEFDESEPPPAIFGWMFVIMPALFIAMGLTLAAFVAIAGFRLHKFRSHLFCLVIAGIECAFMPFGTILGALTIIVLMRPGTKRLFWRGRCFRGNQRPAMTSP